MEREFEAYLSGELNGENRRKLEEELSKSPEMKQEFELFKMLWNDISDLPLPEPGIEVTNRFEKMLLDEIKAEQRKKAWQTWLPKLGIAAALLLVGGFLGKTWQRNSDSSGTEVEKLTHEVKELREMMMLQMIKDPMATERLKAVSLSAELPEVNKTVIEALFTTLNYDDNDNVRLVTLETLAQWADRPLVREGLIKSMAHQESPIVQLSMAELMIQLQEKRALQPIRDLLKNPGLNPAVKQELEKTAQQLKVI